MVCGLSLSKVVVTHTQLFQTHTHTHTHTHKGEEREKILLSILFGGCYDDQPLKTEGLVAAAVESVDC
jgi:hypothetical protein